MGGKTLPPIAISTGGGGPSSHNASVTGTSGSQIRPSTSVTNLKQPITSPSASASSEAGASEENKEAKGGVKYCE